MQKKANYLRKLDSLSILCAILFSLSAQPALALRDADDIVGYVPCALDAGDSALCDETTLGRAVADALCYVSGAQIAIVNGGDLGPGLGVGTYTYGEVQSVFQNDRDLAVAQVTPKELCAILEAGVSHVVVDPETSLIKREQSAFAGFPQVSGFWFQYDAAGPAGERIMYIKLDGEEELDLSDDTSLISTVATNDMLSGIYDFPKIQDASPVGMKLSEAFANYIASSEDSNMGGGSNMTAAGSRDKALISYVPKWVLPLLLLILIVCAASGNRIKKMSGVRTYEESHNPLL